MPLKLRSHNPRRSETVRMKQDKKNNNKLEEKDWWECCMRGERGRAESQAFVKSKLGRGKG
jgi:hypothetical protein